MNTLLHHRIGLRRRLGGFTLIEAAMTTVIVGVGFMAMLQLLAAGTKSNLQGVEHTTGMNLAKNVREMTLKLPYAQLAGLNGKVYQPVIDSQGKTLSGYGDWQQTLSVHPADPNRITLEITDASPVALHCTVNVTRNGKGVSSLSWYAFDGTP
jgi:hypothetical protein